MFNILKAVLDIAAGFGVMQASTIAATKVIEIGGITDKTVQACIRVGFTGLGMAGGSIAGDGINRRIDQSEMLAKRLLGLSAPKTEGVTHE